MIEKNIKLIDLVRLTEFKALCDKAYARKTDSGNYNPSYVAQPLTDDDCNEEEILSIITTITE